MATCVIITAIICVLLTTVAIIISFATPNWVNFQFDTQELCGCMKCDCGLWLFCNGGFLTDGSIDNCRWFFANEFDVEKKLPGWFKAVQGLMSGAVATSFLSLIVGLFSLCCYCKHCNPHQAAGVFTVLTFLLLAAAVSVFGAKGHLDYSITAVASDNPLIPPAIFGWSFWLAVGAGGLSFIASILYFCVGGSTNEYV